MEIAATMYDTNVLGFKGPRRMTGCYHCLHHFLDNHCYRSPDHPGVKIKFKTFFTMIDSGAVNKATDNDNFRCRICRKRMEEYR